MVTIWQSPFLDKHSLRKSVARLGGGGGPKGQRYNTLFDDMLFNI